jgi:hypothetical protein
MERFDRLQASLYVISLLRQPNPTPTLIQPQLKRKAFLSETNDERQPEAERNIRPMTIERSNSKSFGSHEGVESSAVYHTIIATCKAQAISVCEYLKKFFTACIEGRTDYENLTPMMLCQPVK